jgi:RNA recognition motif-containing protein
VSVIDEYKEKNVFIDRIPSKVTKNDLTDAFSKYDVVSFVWRVFKDLLVIGLHALFLSKSNMLNDKCHS